MFNILQAPKQFWCSYGTNSLVYYLDMLKIRYFQDWHSTLNQQKQ